MLLLPAPGSPCLAPRGNGSTVPRLRLINCTTCTCEHVEAREPVLDLFSCRLAMVSESAFEVKAGT